MGGKQLHRIAEALTVSKVVFVLAASLLLLETRDAGAGIILSTQGPAELPGLSFGNGDLVEWDGTAATIFMADPFSGGGNVDAAHLLANGNIILSVASDGESIGGVIYDEGDLIEYNPNTGGSTLFFDEALFTASGDSWRPDIDAVFVQSDGKIILSTRDTEELGGLTFLDGDLILYDPIADTASFFFQETLVFDTNAEVDAVHVLPNGHILLSTELDESIGGVPFTRDDVIDYDPISGAITIIFDGSNFTASDENIDAIMMVPEPGVPALLGLGLIVLAAMGQRSRKPL